jgi:hypothetical protein
MKRWAVGMTRADKVVMREHKVNCRCESPANHRHVHDCDGSPAVSGSGFSGMNEWPPNSTAEWTQCYKNTHPLTTKFRGFFLSCCFIPTKWQYLLSRRNH